MSKTESKELNIELQIIAIELLRSSIELPAKQDEPITSFNFNIEIESRIDAPKKRVFLIVHVTVKNEEETVVLGNLSVSCIYEIGNFKDVVKVKTDGHMDVPRQLIETLNSISISTTRGIMFSTFKGTFLHGAVLPIIDPKQFQATSK